MIPFFEEKKESLYLRHKNSRHEPPHLHNGIEFVYVTEGTLEFGMGEELFHMEQGDLAVAFPEVMHHYQVLTPGRNRGIYLLALPILGGQFLETMQKYCPENPVISKENVHPDIPNALQCLLRDQARNSILEQAYTQIILARSLPCFQLMEKEKVGSKDMVYQTVSYIARNFREELSLEKMARDMGVSKFTLSRVFSGTFHRNFKQYLNEQRLNYACSLLEYTDRSITEICMDSGFESQRTFNRVFQERYRMTPREYRERFLPR